MSADNQYAVIEHTPGYLPDADESVTFEDLRSANEYLREEVERYVDFLCDGYGYAEDYEPVVTWDADYPDESVSALVEDPRRAHDLGRYFTIVEES